MDASLIKEFGFNTGLLLIALGAVRYLFLEFTKYMKEQQVKTEARESSYIDITKKLVEELQKVTGSNVVMTEELQRLNTTNSVLVSLLSNVPINKVVDISHNSVGGG